jgi:hypothetical protein
MRLQVPRRRPPILTPMLAAILGISLFGASSAKGASLTTKSPEVLKAIEQGIAYLEANGPNDPRQGALARAGLAILKQSGKSDHPKVLECAAKIRATLQEKNGKIDWGDQAVYSVGLSILFLVELDPEKYRSDVQLLLSYLQGIQKSHGGWGYLTSKPTGDTSMTQYGVLSSWVAKQAGFSVSNESIEKVADWLLKTQDPSGAFGYQGTPAASYDKLIEQPEIRPALAAAGVGSLYFCSSMLGITAKVERRGRRLPPGLREVKPKDEPSRTSIDAKVMRAAQARGNQWFSKNFKVDIGQWNYYYLYAYERYKSIMEYTEKTGETDPQWYSDCAEFLLKKQKPNGSWDGDGCGDVPDTAFCVLFLLRSMRTTIAAKHDFDKGVTIVGRGIPPDTSQLELRNGQVVAKPLMSSADEVLSNLEDPANKDFEKNVELLDGLPSEKLEQLSVQQAEMIRKLVSNKSAKARLAAVKALGKTRNIDNAATLIYALSDPEIIVAHEAHVALLRISRNPSLVALSENPSDEERRAAIEKWKAWYRTFRPGAELDF